MRVRSLFSRLAPIALAAGSVLGVGLLDPALAAGVTGDFDGDLVADLAVGAPYEDTGSAADAGGVNILYGSRSAGVTASRNYLLFQTMIGDGAGSEPYDFFGSALAAGDFNNDGFSDLAIGAPGEDGPPGSPDLGSVSVIYGSPYGLGQQSVIASQYLERADFYPQPVFVINDSARFGSTLATGDFDDDGFDDLVIGAPNATYYHFFGRVRHDYEGAGVVLVIFGSNNGLTRLRYQALTGIAAPFVNQERPSPELDAHDGDRFGAALAATDFDHDGAIDLAVGAPGSDFWSGGQLLVPDAGALHLFLGSRTGLGSRARTFVPVGPPQASAQFGSVLCGGDFNGDRKGDLACGTPRATVNGRPSAGAVFVIYDPMVAGTDARDAWHQSSSGIPGVAEVLDSFGAALAAGDFSGDGIDDLAIGVPGEDFSGLTDAGAILVLFGSPERLSAIGSRDFSQNSAGVSGIAESSDRFGASLSAVDLGRQEQTDLVVGIPGQARLLQDGTRRQSSGAVAVLYDLEPGANVVDQLWTQDSPGISGACESGDRFGAVLP